MSRLRRLPWEKIRTRLILAVLAFSFIGVFPNDTPGGNSLNDKVLAKASDWLFNYVTWETGAIAGKIGEGQIGVAPYLTDSERAKYVHDYLQVVGKLQSLDARISAVYSDPGVKDPAAASAQMRDQRDTLRRQADEEQPLAEAIVETQVASVLRDQGFATLGEVLPAVSAHITELPMLLVISPRDKIQFENAVNVVNMSADAANALEDSIDKQLNVSSLVVPLGGLSLYPSMVFETWHAPSLFEVVAHEWSHHYLYFFPLGLDYNDFPETRIINETTASLFGKEMARLVIERFYQDYPDILSLLPPPIVPSTSPAPTPQPTATPPQDPDAPPPFNFDAEMNTTRVTVDFYLHFGLVDLAERYMDVQRSVFAEHGFAIRKLNQAYFAFYGGYQSPGAGAAGADPIGPAILEIRERSASLKAWIDAMRSITSREQLLRVRDAMQTQTSE